MEADASLKSIITLLCDISHAGFAYDSTKAICEQVGYTLDYDEPELGFVRYTVPMQICIDPQTFLSVQIAEKNNPASAFLPLFYFEEYEESREQYDLEFRTLMAKLVYILDSESVAGKYSYPHRLDWQYFYAGWTLPDYTLVLVQDEFDIQFGMDITLWCLPAGNEVSVPIRAENNRQG